MRTSPAAEAANTKYGGIARALRERVREMGPGQKLDSVRRLMKEFDASQATIYSALDLLKQEGAVEHVPGRGIHSPQIGRSPETQALLAVAERTTSPFHQHLILELCRKARQFSLRLLVESYPAADDVPAVWPPADTKAGILIPGRDSLTPELLASWRTRQLPFVVADRDLQELGVDCVYADPYRGGQLAARHLLELGHRRLGIVNHQPNSINLSRRVRGFLDATQDHGDVQVSLLETQQPMAGEDIAPLIREGFTKSPTMTAIFSMTHTSTLATLRALQEMGKRVPADVSLIGYDYLQSLTYPAITTVDQSVADIAEAACRTLRRRLDGDTQANLHHVSPTEITVRASTAAVSS